MYMRCFDEAKCQICKQIFCCGNCRQKHQFEAHAIAVTKPVAQHNQPGNGTDNAMENKPTTTATETIYVFCPICEQKPLALREEMYTELLAHIESVHLPLRCRKCQRNYLKIEDLREFSKCLDVGQNCSSSSSIQNQTNDTDASKVTVKKAAVVANTIATQTSPSIAKDMNESQSQQPNHANLTPISLINLRWKAKSRLTHEEFIGDSVSSIRNLSSDSVNLSAQQRRSIGLATALPEKGKVIRSTSTPLPISNMFAKPKDALTFNGSGVGGAHMSSIYHSGYALDEQHTAPTSASASLDNNQLHQQQQPPPPPPPPQRPWKVGGRGKISAVTPLRQVMSRSIQKAFVEHGVGILASTQGTQRRMRLDMSEYSSPEAGLALDLRMSPVVRRSQSVEESVENKQAAIALHPVEPYQILLSAQKLTTESIIITRTQHGANSGSLGSSTASASTTSTVYNSCESVEIITSSTSAELSANVVVPPITPISRIPGAIINKKLIKFETPQKKLEVSTSQKAESTPDDKEIFYTPAAVSDQAAVSSNEKRRQQIIPRQLSDEFIVQPKRQQPSQLPRPLGPRARPPLHACQTQKTFSSVEDLISDDEDEVFAPNSASTHNDKKRIATLAATAADAADGQSEPGRLWSLMSSVMRLPLGLRSDKGGGSSSSADKENAQPNTTNSTGSLIRRCASIAGSLVRTMQAHDDTDMQPLKRKRTQTLDNQYYSQMSPKRLRIQARKPIDRMRRQLS